jgi:hypothetical protein
MAMKFTAVPGPNGAFISFGDMYGRLYDCTCDSSYPNTGNDSNSGYKVTGQVALSQVLYGFPDPKTQPAMGIPAQYRPDTGYIRLVLPTGNANLSANGNYGNNSVGNGIELANNTNCSTLTYRFLFLGY